MDNKTNNLGLVVLAISLFISSIFIVRGLMIQARVEAMVAGFEPLEYVVFMERVDFFK